MFCSSVHALEFERESDKAQWIREFFERNHIKSYEILFNNDKTAARRKLGYEILSLFLKQKGLEHIEPIVRGRDINSPEITKFNVACPDKRPINLAKDAYYGAGFCDDTTDFSQEDWDAWGVGQQCQENMKVFKLDVNNGKEDADRYIIFIIWGDILIR